MDLSERSQAGRRHPWEVARARFFGDVLVRTGAVTAQSRILDVGAGDAFIARTLIKRCPGCRVCAWDHAYADDEMASLRQLGIESARVCPPGAFDVALLLDVLEHVDDDSGVLTEVRGALAPSARMLVSLPAWPALRSSHDMYLRHRRRYTPATARALLEGSGFVITRHGGLFHSLLLARALSATLERYRAVTSFDGLGGWTGGAAMTSLATTGLSADIALSHTFARLGLEVPGLSWWALCTRSGAPA
jgi:SAM-dependent methyltransferase